MTTVSRTSQVTHSSVTGGGEWDHRLNRLLEDLQGTVVPEDSKSSGTEYREYRMTSSSRTNDEPPMKVEEKWVEYGSRGDHAPSSSTAGYHSHLRDHAHSHSTSSSSKTFQKAICGSEPHNGVTKSYGVDPGLKSGRTTTQIEYMTPANTTTQLKSSSSSSGMSCPSTSLLPSSSPKVERKEFYAKASYTTLIKAGGANGGGGGGPITSHDLHDRSIVDHFDEFSDQPPYYPPTAPAPLVSSTKSSSETRREYSRTTERRETPSPFEPAPHYSSTTPPTHQVSSYNKRIDERSVRSSTPPPPDPLKTPPLIRKMMQQSESNYRKEVRTTREREPVPYEVRTTRERDPVPYEIQTPKPPPPVTQYYTSTTTRTEARERDGVSPVRQFPTPSTPKPAYGEPPKRLDELLATFGESYTETSKISGDGGGPWKSTPYGPGTRSVKINDTVQNRAVAVKDDSDGITQRKVGSGSSGPVGLYPPPGPVYKVEEQALMSEREGGKGKAKMKMDRKYKAGEKSKSSHSESGGQGAAPIPVCVPVCCAAPCVIV